MTGLNFIDVRLGGLRSGHLVVLAGRPSMGKTAVCDNIAFGAAEHNPEHLIVVHTMEMTARELVERAVSAASYRGNDTDMISYSRLGKMTAAQRAPWRSLAATLPKNLRIDERPRVSVATVRQSIWGAKAAGKKVGAVFIDQLDLMELPPAAGRNESSVVGEVARELKLLAAETGVTIVLLVQLSRGPEGRENKRPMLNDLRKSGEIEQAANTVIFVYRDSYYADRAADAQAKHSPGVDESDMELICAKQRNGPIGTDKALCYLAFDVVVNGAGGAA